MNLINSKFSKIRIKISKRDKQSDYVFLKKGVTSFLKLEKCYCRKKLALSSSLSSRKKWESSYYNQYYLSIEAI